MNKQIVYISYLIVFFVIYNFVYGFTDWVGTWQLWHWYLIVLCGVIGVLLYLKLKQQERKIHLTKEISDLEHVRMQLSQLLFFEQLKNLDDPSFNQFLKQVYELQGYHSIEPGGKELGYDLALWKDGVKFVVKWFKMVPLLSHLYKEKDDFTFEPGQMVGIQQLREAFGAMKDYEVQADELIVISTSCFDEGAKTFAARNGIKLLAGKDFYNELEILREPASADYLDENPLLAVDL